VLAETRKHTPAMGVPQDAHAAPLPPTAVATHGTRSEGTARARGRDENSGVFTHSTPAPMIVTSREHADTAAPAGAIPLPVPTDSREKGGRGGRAGEGSDPRRPGERDETGTAGRPPTVARMGGERSAVPGRCGAATHKGRSTQRDAERCDKVAASAVAPSRFAKGVAAPHMPRAGPRGLEQMAKRRRLTGERETLGHTEHNNAVLPPPLHHAGPFRPGSPAASPSLSRFRRWGRCGAPDEVPGGCRGGGAPSSHPPCRRHHGGDMP